MSLFKNPLLNLVEFENFIDDIKKKKFPILLTDVSDGAKAHVISETEFKWKLVITYDEDNVLRLANDIGCFIENVHIYPAKDLLFFSADIKSGEVEARRIEVFKSITTMDSGVVVTTIDAMMDGLEDKDAFRQASIEINRDDSINLSELSKKLSRLGYERGTEAVTQGTFSIRGGIIDIFPITEELPVRIELWDEEIDFMRTYDPESQRSISDLDSVVIYRARENSGNSSFLDYFEDDYCVFLDESARCLDRAKMVEDEFKNAVFGRMESEDFDMEVPDIISSADIFERLSKQPTIAISGLDFRIRELRTNSIRSIDSRSSGVYHEAFESLISDLTRYKRDKYRIALISPSRTRARRLADSLTNDYGLNAIYIEETQNVDILPGQIVIFNGNIHAGFEYQGVKFALLSESDIFGKRKQKKKRKKEVVSDRVSSLSELHIGDYVVHEDHGIGIYRGIEKIEQAGAIKDYVKIEYHGTDVCFVPVSKLDRIQKYGDRDIKPPKLNRLGGSEWTKTKTKVKKKVDEMARELIELYAQRLENKGVVYSQDTVWQQEFEEMFEYDETNDQLRAVSDIKADLEAGKIMDRLVCGDVGYGKTEVALRAAFKVIQEGYQVLYLVPTTILASQHYNTFVQRMKNFPVNIAIMSRFSSQTAIKKVKSDLKSGLVDIVIGTHRILSKDIEPKKLGLIIVDEEQRFGVKHKEKLKELCRNVNVLTLSATPIPRTLHMSLSGIRDLSVLEEAPIDRKPIQTYVMSYNDEIVKEAIRREVKRGGQVYYLYNRVKDIEEIAAHIQAILPEINIEFVHGRMNERELEDKMLDFINGDTDVLVTTTIVETGLDVPNANTIIIHDADHLGLAQLYQLRGRVGRSKRNAYAFLLYSRGKLPSEEANKRLMAIKEFTELGSGIKIAMRDLEIRGAGNVLGTSQSGHMQAVGYDLYVKLLNMAINALRDGKEMEEVVDTSVEIDSDAYIPMDYIPSEEQKLEIYKKIANIRTEADYMDMQDELIDRFGDMSEPVNNLLLVARIKSIANSMSITDVLVNKLQIRFVMKITDRVNLTKINKYIKKLDGDMAFGYDTVLRFEYRDKKKISTDNRLDKCIELLLEMREEIF